MDKYLYLLIGICLLLSICVAGNKNKIAKVR
jgi:hypothetical protein